jgi:hypothetical protein
MSETEVLDMVERYLKPYQPTDFHLDVEREGISRDGDWWYVVVTPSKPDIRAYDYDQIVSRAEDEIERDEGIKVLLVPVKPE